MGKGSYITQAPLVVPGTQLWLDANDPLGTGVVPADSTALSSWVDKSGFKRNAAQATGSQQPLVRTNIQAGKPVIRFDGTNDVMSTGSVMSLGANSTIIIAFKFITFTAIGCIYNNVVGSSGSSQFGLHSDTSSGGRAYLYNGAIAPIGVTNTTAKIVNVAWNGSSTQYSVNGAAFATGVAGTAGSNLTGLFIGANTGAGSLPANVDVMELMVYPRALTAAESLFLYRYLSNKWGI